MIARKPQVSSQNIYPDMGDRIAKLSLWALGAAVVLQFIMPFIYPIVGHDAAVHLNWLEQFPRLFRDGNLYPRWMPDSFGDFGSPAFYFYPPLTYWCAGLISFIFPNSPVAIYQTLGLLATIASVFTCYLYLRSLVDSKRSAFIGALVYGVFPYRLLDLYLRNAIGEHIAFVFLPLIFLSIESTLHCSIRKKTVSTIVISTIGWAGILFSNIPVAVIAIYTLPIYSIIRARENMLYKSLISPLIGALIGLMIAAIYLLPVTEFTGYIKLSHIWDLQVLQSNSGYAMIDIMSGKYRHFYIGLLGMIASGAWLFYLFFRNRKKSENKNVQTTFLIILGVALAFQIPYVLQPLSNILPLFKLMQFSYRWNTLIVFSGAVYIAFYYEVSKGKAAEWFIGIASLATIVISFGYFSTMNGMNWEYQASQSHIDAPEYLPASANNNLELAKNAFKDHALDGLISSPGDSARFHIFSAGPEMIRFSMDKPSSEVYIAFHRAYFPTWRLRSNEGNEILLTADSLGRINAILPPVSAEYILSLEESKAEKTGEIISLAGLALLAAALVLTISWRNPKVS